MGSYARDFLIFCVIIFGAVSHSSFFGLILFILLVFFRLLFLVILDAIVIYSCSIF